MSWLYSRALVEAFSAANCSDGEPCAQLNVMPTPHSFLRNDKTMDASMLSQSGLTFAVLTDDRGAELLMWYLAGFPAKTSAPREKAQELPASEADSGPKWRELSVRYDPATSSWKTHQCLFQEDLPESSVTLPKWGMMRDGVLSERTTLALPTSGTESGLWPTPTTQDNPQIKGKDKRGTTLGGAVRMWPTPRAGNPGSRPNGKGDRILEEEVKIAEGLRERRKTLPTPKSRDWKGQSQRGIHTPGDALPNQDRGDGRPIGGQLNPTWVEWLIGWPLGWTDLSALATDKFQQWLHSHGKY